MTTRTRILETIQRGGVIGVLRGVDADTVPSIARALADGGVSAVEVTADTQDAPDLIRTLSSDLAEREVVVGAGTVLDGATARAVQLAGAEFIVTPTVDEGVIETANRYATPVIPGVMTPTEAQQAIESGADAVKLFPASTVGPDHVGALRGPLPQLEVVPTGGVSAKNAGAYIEAGAMAVGVGSALVDEELVTAGDWDGLRERAETIVAAVEAAR